MDDLARRMSYLTINNNDNQIVRHYQNSQQGLSLVPTKGRKKKKPEPPKVFTDEDAFKSWILIQEDGKEKKDARNYWKEQREIFFSRVFLFIKRMHVIQGHECSRLIIRTFFTNFPILSLTKKKC